MTIKRKLSIGKLTKEDGCLKEFFNQKREYKLSYSEDDKILNPINMEIEDIIDYVQKEYVERKGKIEKNCLVNDLLIFKNCRYDLQLSIENFEKVFTFWVKIITLFISLIVLISGIDKENINTNENGMHNTDNKVSAQVAFNPLAMLAVPIIYLINIIVKSPISYKSIYALFLLSPLIRISYAYLRFGRKTYTNKLKTINQVINLLEDMDKEIDFNKKLKMIIKS